MTARIIPVAPYTAQPRSREGDLTTEEILALPPDDRHHALMLYISTLNRRVDETIVHAEETLTRFKHSDP